MAETVATQPKARNLQDKCAEFGHSLICAFIFAPMLFLGAMYLLGWNEQRAVCQSRAIYEGEDTVVMPGCAASMAANGDLVLFFCPILKDPLPKIGFEGTDFDIATMDLQGTGLEVVSEMRQCVETATTETKDDPEGGGGTVEVTTYTYSIDWVGSPVDSGAFQDKAGTSWMTNCGVENPAWPAQVPRGVRLQVEMTAGLAGDAYVLGPAFVGAVPLTASVTAATTPASWTVANKLYSSEQWAVGEAGIGSVRAKFYSNDWSAATGQPAMITVLGENTNGRIDTWTASDSWLCSGFTMREIRMGTVSKSALFSALESENDSLTFLWRFLGFLLAWAAVSMIFSPLTFLAKCFPFCGKCMGEAVAFVACYVACLPACACSMLVIGIVWVAMRPLVGIPLMLAALLILGIAAWRAYTLQKEKDEDDQDVERQN